MKENEAALPAIATCAHRHRARDAILGRPQDLNGDGIVPRRPLLCCCKLGTPRGRRPRHAAHKHHTTLNHTILFNALQTSMHNTFTHLILIFSRPNNFYQLSVFFFFITCYKVYVKQFSTPFTSQTAMLIHHESRINTKNQYLSGRRRFLPAERRWAAAAPAHPRTSLSEN